MRVDVEGGGGTGVAEAAGGGAHIDAVEQHGRRGEVPQVVEPNASDVGTAARRAKARVA